MKKGDLSINVIIVAAVGLLILVILAVLLFGTGGKIRAGTEGCSAIGGQCQPDSCSALADSEGGLWIPDPSKDCGEQQVCCYRTGGSSN